MFGRGAPFGSLFGGDPFLSDPFSHMDRMMNSMFNDPFFANPMGVGVRQPGLHPLQQDQYPRGRQPVIEEVDDASGGPATAPDQPIVEEPDDEGLPHDRAAQRPRRHSPPRPAAAYAPAAPQMDPFGQLFGALANGGAAAGPSFMFSSSSYSSMGPGGMAYQSSSTTRMGPGGVLETQAVVRDGRSGTESVTISRGLGDGRQRTLVRTRDAVTGREEQLEDLKGISQHDADAFDDQWRQHAEVSLPGGGGRGGSRVGGGRSGAQRPLALPSSASVPSAAAAPSVQYADPTAPRVSYPAASSRSRQQHAGSAHHAAPGSTGGRSHQAAGGGRSTVQGDGQGVRSGPYGAPAAYYASSSRVGSGRGTGPEGQYSPRQPPQQGGGVRDMSGSGGYGAGSQVQQRYRY